MDLPVLGSLMSMLIAWALTAMFLYQGMHAFAGSLFWVIPATLASVAVVWFIVLTYQTLCTIRQHTGLSASQVMRRWGVMFILGHAVIYWLTVLLYAVLFAGFAYALTVLVYGLFWGDVPATPGTELALELPAVQIIAVSSVLLSAYMQRGMACIVRASEPGLNYLAANRKAHQLLHAPALVRKGHVGLITLIPNMAVIPIWFGFGHERVVYFSLLLAAVLCTYIAYRLSDLLWAKYAKTKPSTISVAPHDPLGV